MSKRKEKISAFLDNDMHQDELMSFSLSAEAGDAKVAQHYQMIGDALRGEVSDASFVDVSHAVREALANENIAEQNITEQVVSERGATNKSAAEKSGLFDLSAWFKPVAGMAVAASVAVVMVVMVTGQDTAGMAPMASNTDIQQQGQSTAVQLAAEQPAINLLATDNNVANTQENDLNSYVNQHLNFATQDTLQGRLPYVRAVSFESESAAKSPAEK